MSRCSRCGTEAAPTDRFCKKCGQRFDVNDPDFALAERAPMYVPPSGLRLASDTSTPSSQPAPLAQPRNDPRTAASPPSGGPVSGPAVATATIPAVARLIVRPIASTDPADAHEYALDGRDVAIGRSPSCDIRLEGDQLISRRHALLRYDGERYTIVDLGSSNGTYVNDVEITEAHPLVEGDRILLGEHELTYAAGPASAAATAAGAPLGERITARTPAPKTAPHVAALPPVDLTPNPEHAAALQEPEQAEPTIPKSDLAPEESDAAPTALMAAAPAPTAADELSPPPSDAAAPAPMDGPPSAPSEAASTTNAPGDLEEVRAEVAQLLAKVEALAQRADEATRQADQWHAALGEARERLSGLISELQRLTSDADEGEDLTPLIRVARQAAENPRHVDYMMQLADSAADLLDVLERRQTQRTAPAEILNALTTLRAWMYRLG